jgi:hypothetical protein
LYIFTDPPEIEVERSWVHSGEGFEAQLVCIVHADPPAVVSTIGEGKFTNFDLQMSNQKSGKYGRTQRRHDWHQL